MDAYSLIEKARTLEEISAVIKVLYMSDVEDQLLLMAAHQKFNQLSLRNV